MKLLEDLGLRYATVNSTKRARFGIYECPICEQPFTTNTYNVNHGKTTKCRSCATSLGNKKRNRK